MSVKQEREERGGRRGSECEAGERGGEVGRGSECEAGEGAERGRRGGGGRGGRERE